MVNMSRRIQQRQLAEFDGMKRVDQLASMGKEGVPYRGIVFLNGQHIPRVHEADAKTGRVVTPSYIPGEDPWNLFAAPAVDDASGMVRTEEKFGVVVIVALDQTGKPIPVGSAREPAKMKRATYTKRGFHPDEDTIA